VGRQSRRERTHRVIEHIVPLGADMADLGKAWTAAARALCDEAELADPDVVFSQGGPRWSVWTSDVRAALDGGEAE
jgi:hypothetical protein